MKRLLCLISCMNTGGAETFLMKIYRALDKTKYQMDFCINNIWECFYEKEILALGGKIYYIPAKSEDMEEFKKQLTKIVKDQSYQYVLRVTSNAAGFMDLKIAKKAGAKICVARSSNSSDGQGIKVKVAHHLGRAFYNNYVDVKLAPSKLAGEYTFGKRAVKNSKVHYLHNALDLDDFHLDEVGRQQIRKELRINEKEIVVGHIGRFMKQKNHDFLIDIFSEVHKQNPDTVLMLVGKGELEQQIYDKVQSLDLTENVIFTGVRSDIPQLLSAMDVLVMPSFYEGMPNTVVEAQATGLPCLIADTITSEADITGLVHFLPLSLTSFDWATKVLNLVNTEARIDTKEDFIEHGYDIESVTQQFVDLIFEGKATSENKN